MNAYLLPPHVQLISVVDSEVTVLHQIRVRPRRFHAVDADPDQDGPHRDQTVCESHTPAMAPCAHEVCASSPFLLRPTFSTPHPIFQVPASPHALVPRLSPSTLPRSPHPLIHCV